MIKEKFSGKLGESIERAERGNEEDVDYIMGHLTDDSTLAMTRYVDFALSLVEKVKRNFTFGILFIQWHTHPT